MESKKIKLLSYHRKGSCFFNVENLDTDEVSDTSLLADVLGFSVGNEML